MRPTQNRKCESRGRERYINEQLLNAHAKTETETETDRQTASQAGRQANKNR